MQNQTILPVILAGDTGQGLWPVSRDSLPAQFAGLVEGPTLFQQTVIRVADPQLFAPALIITTRRGVRLVADQLSQLGCDGARIVCGPVGLGSAGAVALALELEGNEGNRSVMVVPAGHAVNDSFAFRRAAGAASRLALRNACIVAIGIPPEHPETRCGYLRTGAPILGEPGLLLDSFVEHPSTDLAARLLRTPGTFWNSGVFLFEPEVARSELTAHAPELASQARAAVAGGTWDGGIFRPDNSHFTSASNLSFEQAVLARTGRAAVTPGDPGWSDLATWKAVWENSPQDSNRNVISGQAYCVNTTNSMALTDGPVVGIAGLDDVVVVASRDAVLVASRSEPDDVDRLVDEMRADGVEAVLSRNNETWNWGMIQSLDRGDNHQVRRVTLNAGESLPTQYHHHRCEHWVVVAGLATVTLEDHVMMLGAGQQVFIPLGAMHRLENLSHETVELIEIRFGHYIGEDDVVLAAMDAAAPAGSKAANMARVA